MTEFGRDICITICAGGRHNMPRPLQVDLWPFDIEGGVRVTCDVGYLCAATDRRQTRIIAYCPLPRGGGI